MRKQTFMTCAVRRIACDVTHYPRRARRRDERADASRTDHEKGERPALRFNGERRRLYYQDRQRNAEQDPQLDGEGPRGVRRERVRERLANGDERVIAAAHGCSEDACDVDERLLRSHIGRRGLRASARAEMERRTAPQAGHKRDSALRQVWRQQTEKRITTNPSRRGRSDTRRFAKSGRLRREGAHDVQDAAEAVSRIHSSARAQI